MIEFAALKPKTYSYLRNDKNGKSFRNSWGNTYIPSLLLLITLCFTCGEGKFGQTSKINKIVWPWF